MRTLKYLIAAFLFVLLVGYLIGLFLPSKTLVQNSITINRSSEVVYKVLNSMKNFNRWSPWVVENSSFLYETSGEETGPGSILKWSNKSKEKGYIEIVNVEPNQKVQQELVFGKSNNQAVSLLNLASKDPKTTEVTWSLELDAGSNVIKRYSGLVADDILAPDLIKGLNNLKELVESLPLHDYSNVTVVDLEEQNIYAKKIKENTNQDQLAIEIGAAYQEIIKFLSDSGNVFINSPIVITEIKDNQKYSLTAALAVAEYSEVESENEIYKDKLPSGKAIKIVHKGPYDNLQSTYKILNAYIYQNQLQPRSNAWEEYVSDPGSTEEKDLITNIILPIEPF